MKNNQYLPYQRMKPQLDYEPPTIPHIPVEQPQPERDVPLPLEEPYQPSERPHTPPDPFGHNEEPQPEDLPLHYPEQLPGYDNLGGAKRQC